MFPATDERIRKLLPFEVLSRLAKQSKVIVNAGSCLWDLSEGCVAKGAVDESYAQEYIEGIQRLHRVLMDIIPGVTIYWRTCPPISQPYDMDRAKSGWGRTRSNQAILNNLLKRTVSEYNLGKVVDWWTQFSGVPEETITESMGDRTVHYRKEPTLAFFNMWLNTVFNDDPSLRVLPGVEDNEMA